MVAYTADELVECPLGKLYPPTSRKFCIFGLLLNGRVRHTMSLIKVVVSSDVDSVKVICCAFFLSTAKYSTAINTAMQVLSPRKEKKLLR